MTSILFYGIKVCRVKVNSGTFHKTLKCVIISDLHVCSLFLPVFSNGFE